MSNLHFHNFLFNHTYLLFGDFHNLRRARIIDRVWNLNFLDNFTDHWNLNTFFNNFNFCIVDDSIDHFFDNLGNLANFFNNSWYYNDFLHDLLHFDDFWHFHHFFNNLINVYSDFLDSFDSFGYLYNNLFFHENGFLFDKRDNFCFLNFNNVWYFNHFFNNFFELVNNWNFRSLNHNLSIYFRNDLKSLNFIRNLNNFFDNLFPFFNDRRRTDLNYLFNLNNSINIDRDFFFNINFLNSWNFNFNFNNFLNDFRNFNNSFNSSNKWYFNFITYFNNFGNLLNMVDNFSSIDNFDLFDKFLYSLFG